MGDTSVLTLAAVSTFLFTPYLPGPSQSSYYLRAHRTHSAVDHTIHDSTHPNTHDCKDLECEKFLSQ